MFSKILQTINKSPTKAAEAPESTKSSNAKMVNLGIAKDSSHAESQQQKSTKEEKAPECDNYVIHSGRKMVIEEKS